MGIQYEIDERGVARVTLDRPEVLNAVDAEAHERLHEVWEDIESRTDIRAVVLTGSGDRAFCVGSDMKSVDRSGVEYWASGHPDGYGGLTVRRSLNVPVIGRVNGYALGGGLELMLGCDIVVAASHAQFGLPEARVGRIPLDGGVVQLSRQMPWRQALYLLLTGDRISATRAMELGLINEVVPMAELDAAVERIIDAVLLCAPLSLKATKAILNRADGMSARDATALRLPEVTQALTSKDAVEGVQAFIEKRQPMWTGQ